MNSHPKTQLWINQGTKVRHEGRDYVVLSLVDVSRVFAKDLETGNKVLLDIGALGAPTLVAEMPPAPKAETVSAPIEY